jgi:hypothetical protein
VNDTDQLRNLLQRYARAVDERDLDALRAVFHADAIIEGFRGTQTVDEWLAAMAEPRTFPSSMHCIGDPLIELDGDHATVDAYAVVYQLGDAAAGQSDLTLGMHYRDTVERVHGEWRIRHRTPTTRWMR